MRNTQGRQRALGEVASDAPGSSERRARAHTERRKPGWPASDVGHPSCVAEISVQMDAPMPVGPPEYISWGTVTISAQTIRVLAHVIQLNRVSIFMRSGRDLIQV